MAVVGIEIVREGEGGGCCHATVPRVLFTRWRAVRARERRLGLGALGTPAAGLCPRPAREKGFPSNLLVG